MIPGESLANWLRLALVPGIGGGTQRKLLAAFGGPDQIFAACRDEVREAIGEKASKLLLDTDNAAAVSEALEWASKAGQSVVTLGDSEYPQYVLEIPDPPILLYVRGRLDLLNRQVISIVGSRSPTPQGIQNADSFAAAFVEAGLVVASGMALGIDAAAHRGALSISGDTIAFVGTGIDRIYPARNRDLALEIGARGCMVSEFPIGTPVSAANFPRRNRLISGVSRGVLVVEAAVESGSLITARLANDQGRDVFAIPGSIHSPQSRGCHQLIQQGAKLVETALDVLEEIGWQGAEKAKQVVDASKGIDGPSGASELLSLLGYEPSGLDELAARSGMATDALSVALLHLVLDGLVACLPGGRYQRTRSA